jgi:NADH:ubiquinone oxidoreductase subunit 2 (subunit N)
MEGAARRAPLAGVALVVSALSLIGIPPLAGFIGKWDVTLDALRQQHFVPAAAISLGTLLSAVYYGRMVRTLFGAAVRTDAGQSPARPLMTAILLAGAAGCVLPFAFWGSLQAVVLRIAVLVRG